MADDTPDGEQSRQDDATSADRANETIYAKAWAGQAGRLDPNSEEPGGSTSWSAAMRRAGEVLMPRASRRPRWSLLVPLIAALAGLLFTTTARTAAGTNLRDDRRPEISRLIGERKVQVEDEGNRAAALRAAIDSSTRTEAGSDGRVAAQQQRADGVKQAAGFAPDGPGVRTGKQRDKRDRSRHTDQGRKQHRQDQAPAQHGALGVTGPWPCAAKL